MKNIKYTLLAFGLLLAASCGKEYDIEAVLPEPALTIELNDVKTGIIKDASPDDEFRVGRKATLKASWNSNTRDNNTVVQWATSNDNITIARPDSYASATTYTNHEMEVTANSVGTTTVTVQVGDNTCSYDVEVLHLADFRPEQDGYRMKFFPLYNHYEYYRAEWDFGDGNTYTWYASLNDTKYTNYNKYYAAKGTYNVALSLYDRNGNLIDRNTKAVTLN
ncbi:MAG: hypothetical protein IJ064_03595 [Bacteroidaceae bacterium]|nr:hypothetical protein [Bacteroidaceae bacterium]